MTYMKCSTLGQVVQSRRAELGLTQAALAERMAALGDWTIRQSDISRLERGKVLLPHRTRMAYLAEALELPMGDLLAISGWAGAETAFKVSQPSASESRQSTIQDDGPASLVVVERSERWPEPPSPPMHSEQLARIRALLDDSQRMLQRTQEIISRSEALSRGQLPGRSEASDWEDISWGMRSIPLTHAVED